MTAKTILAVFGDTQIGSSTAVAPPEFTIHNNDTDEEQVVHHNRLQQWLWQCWIDYWDYVKHLAGVTSKGRKCKIVAVHMGDVIDGNHHGTPQIIQDIGDQKKVAIEMLEPVTDLVDDFFGIIGTEAHAGKVGCDEIQIYKDLGAREYGQSLMIRVDGKVHDFAHHGRVGRRPWSSGAAGMGVEVQLDCGAVGLPFPDFVWRAHNHLIDDSGDKLPGTRVICLPSWQLKTAFTYRVAVNQVRSDIGGYIVDGGVVDNSRSRYKAQPNGRKIIDL